MYHQCEARYNSTSKLIILINLKSKQQRYDKPGMHNDSHNIIIRHAQPVACVDKTFTMIALPFFSLSLYLFYSHGIMRSRILTLIIRLEWTYPKIVRQALLLTRYIIAMYIPRIRSKTKLSPATSGPNLPHQAQHCVAACVIIVRRVIGYSPCNIIPVLSTDRKLVLAYPRNF